MAVASVGFQENAFGGSSGEAVYSTYGGVEYSSAMGSGLLIVGSYDLAAATTAPLPFMTPCDSAGNLYLPLGTLPAGTTNASQARLSAWICPNARPIKWASMGVSTIVSAEIVGIYEFSGFPSWMQLSMTTLYAGGTGTSPSLSGPTNGASFCVGVVAIPTVADTLTNTGSGWNSFTQVASGSTNGITSLVSWMTTSAAGTVTYAPTISSSSPYTAMLGAITLAPVAPTQVNANYPRFIYEAQFGRDLGDLQTAINSPGPAVLANTQNITASTSFSDTYNVAVGGGQTLVAQVTVPAPATITLSDSAGNSYTQLSSTTIPGGTATTYIFEVLDCLAVSTSTTQYFTQTVSQNALTNTIAVPGVWQLDVSPVITGTSAAPSGSTGALGSVLDYELFILTNNGSENSSASVAGFATVQQANQGSMYVSAYGRNSTPGVGFGAFGAGDTLSTTFATSTGWVMNVLAFKAITFTDISTYVRNGAMGQTLHSSQGRPYELSQPEAGELEIRLDTHDGTFFPDNPNSKYYPGVQAETPVRVTCVSDGRQYPVASGYVDSFPLDWPELPQWTISTISATDTVELLTNATLPSGLQCEIRNDNPFVYIPGNEQYSTVLPSTSNYTAGLNDLRTSSECAGFQAINASPYNQRNAYYSDGNAPLSMVSNGTACQTGLSIPYAGTQDTGFGQSNYPTTGLAPNTTYIPHGPGVTYIDPVNLPGQANVTTGITLEWFCEVPGTGTAGSKVESVTLVECVTKPSNCQAYTSSTVSDLIVYTNNPSASVMEFYASTAVAAGQAISSAYVPATTIAGVLTPNVFHCVLTIQGTTVTMWLNGVKQTPLTATVAGGWSEIRLGGARGRFGEPPSIFNYVMGHFALYPYVLPQGRILAHYQMGVNTGLPQPAASENISSYNYMAAALAYSRVPAQAGGPGVSYLPDIGQMGPMYSVQSSSAMDTTNTAVTSEGGMVYIDKQCNTVIQGRNAIYNNPAFVTFGDNGTTQIPALQDSSFGYDDQFLYNVATVQQENGSTEGVLAQGENFGGDLSGQITFGTRNAPAITAQVTQSNDATDQMWWRINKYSSPSIRAKAITVNAAALVGGVIDTALASTGGVVGTLLSCNVGTVVNMTRTPMGANATVAELGVIEHVEITAGPSLLEFQFIISPYNPEGDILQADNTANGSSGFPVNQLGYGSLAW
jgi:hypothetical protein